MSILTHPEPPVRPRCPPRYATWQAAMKDAVRDVDALCELLGLDSRFARQAKEAAADFPLFVPRGFVARMQPGDPNDPLLRQVLPVAAEGATAAGFSADPVGDAAATLRPGLLQKYPGRALLITTGTCAVHCRYCFRRQFPYAELPAADTWDAALAAIASDTSLREVILSGGDPLTLVDERLADLAARIAAIEHVRRLRVHSRLPVVIPERVTDELIAWLTGSRLSPILVIHANHARELDENVAAALARLSHAGVPLLNQAVLLRGVNDSVAAQAELSERLIELRVMPYYVHQLDRVAGAAHFEVPIAEGRRIFAKLRARLPGYAVPRYVQEVAGAASKMVLE